MTRALEKLRQHVDWFGTPAASSDEIHRLWEDQHFRLFVDHFDGTVAYDSGLRIFGTTEQRLPSLRSWNAPETWRVEYGNLAAGLEFFAEDAFGNQFAFAGDSVIKFMAETAERVAYAPDFNGWLERIVDDPDEELTLWLVRDWVEKEGPIAPTDHLCPKIPFVVGGEYKVEALYVLDRVKSLTFKGSIALQIKDLPDGSRIRLNVVR